MNRCPNCAAQNRDGAKFCTSCGFRLPADSPVLVASDRSPFATTSTMPSAAGPFGETPVAVEDAEDERGFAPWSPTPEADATGPGLSWDSTPPQDTSVPVSDEMIASLVGTDEVDEPDVIDAEMHADPEELGLEDEFVTEELVDDEPLDEPVGIDTTSPSGVSSTVTATAPTIDQLLRLARELEYGLIELADASPSGPVASEAGLDNQMLANVLADLQSEDDLAQMRAAVQSALERPRDVDVMLGLVLHADAMASILTERDQLKHAIELALRGANNSAGESIDQDDEDEGSDAAIPL